MHRTFLLGLLLAMSAVLAPSSAADDKSAQKAQPASAVDPVCGMTVETKSAAQSTYKGKTYYFCSREEKQTFDKSPEKYTAQKKK